MGVFNALPHNILKNLLPQFKMENRSAKSRFPALPREGTAWVNLAFGVASLNLRRPAHLQHLAKALCSFFQPFLGGGRPCLRSAGFRGAGSPGAASPRRWRCGAAEPAMSPAAAARRRGRLRGAGSRLPGAAQAGAGGVFLARGPGAVVVVGGSAVPSSQPAPRRKQRDRATPSFSFSECLWALSLLRILNRLLPAACEKNPLGCLSTIIRSSCNLLS